MRQTKCRIGTIAAAALLGLVCVALGTSPAVADPRTSTGALSGVTLRVTYSDTTVAPGDSVTATITFTKLNSSPQFVAYSIGSVAAPFPDVFDLDGCDIPGSVDATCDATADRFRVRVNDLPSKTTTITAHFTVRPDAAAGTYTFDHRLSDFSTSVLLDPDASFTVQPNNADLGVSLTAASSPLVARISYTLTVTNNGPGDSTSATVSTAVPAQTTSVTGLSSGCTYSSPTHTVTCTPTGITNGSNAQLGFQANFGLLSIGALNATATRTASTPADPNAANDTSVASCTALTSLLISCP